MNSEHYGLLAVVFVAVIAVLGMTTLSPSGMAGACTPRHPCIQSVASGPQYISGLSNTWPEDRPGITRENIEPLKYYGTPSVSGEEQRMFSGETYVKRRQELASNDEIFK